MTAYRYMAAGLLALFSFVSSVEATDISADGVHRYFSADKRPVQELIVRNNNSEHTFVLNIAVDRILSTDPKTGLVSTKPASDDFMFAPRSFILKPGQSRNLRVVYTAGFKEDEESRYQLNFKPRIKEVFENDEDADGVRMGATVVSTTGIAMQVAPKVKRTKIVHQRTPIGVAFKNVGNTTVSLRPKAEYCDAGECVSIPKREMDPGEVWFFEMPGSMAYDWYYDVYGKTRRNPIKVNAY